MSNVFGHRSKISNSIDDSYQFEPYFGAHGDEEIPVLIPNTEVKLISGDYTATSGKLARCRIIQTTLRIGGFLFNLNDTAKSGKHQHD